MIDLKKLKQVVGLMVDHDLTEVDLDDGQDKVKLRRGNTAAGQPVMMAPPAPAAAPTAPAAPAAGPPAGTAPAADAGPVIESPMVGTFYSSPSPDSAPFVKVGDKVDADTVVCIVEAMKVFNEIKAEQAGTIDAMLVESGTAVEYGQPLFRLKP
jgi:acetyl-CoA carboxylase biotin carboxyl carrier protein